ncbi:glutamate-rich protein 6 isoform X2 [Protopterus annectens]|uniref:glutamate-rich protein 6 isoform X2 n=1 Tax=Protopterus annectens TaxID=7888 RepID=UPI001CFBED33|nr:glutamate-rich protein 6 isoform X2 [Protopterus annectens]
MEREQEAHGKSSASSSNESAAVRSEKKEETSETNPEKNNSQGRSISVSSSFHEENCAVQGSTHFPRILQGFKREDSFPSSSDVSICEINSLASSEFELFNNASRNSSLSSNEGSWASESCFKETDSILFSVLEDLTDMHILAATEFNEDFLKLMEPFEDTLSTIGPPKILAYKQESVTKVSRPLDVIPQQFCCKEYENLVEFVIKEQEHLSYTKDVEKISVAAHPPHGSQSERERARQRTAQRLREREMEKYYSLLDSDPSLFAYSNQLKVISYQLSNAPPAQGSWATVPPATDSHEEEDEEENEFFIPCDDAEDTCKTAASAQFLEKFYKNGNTFLTKFPDGSAQVLYPSGNVAVIVLRTEQGHITCIVLEDKASDAAIQAVIDSSGKGTCYHPNGVVWVSFDAFGGLYSDEKGNRIKRWMWKSEVSSAQYAPFKPIFLSLNYNIGFRILQKDKIFVNFLAMGKQAKFSFGSRFQMKTSAVQPDGNSYVLEDDLILLAIKIKALKILNKIHGILMFPSSKHWDRLKLPLYLATQTEKLLNLCKNTKVEKDISAIIQYSAEEYV